MKVFDTDIRLSDSESHGGVIYLVRISELNHVLAQMIEIDNSKVRGKKNIIIGKKHRRAINQCFAKIKIVRNGCTSSDKKRRLFSQLHDKNRGRIKFKGQEHDNLRRRGSQCKGAVPEPCDFIISYLYFYLIRRRCGASIPVRQKLDRTSDAAMIDNLNDCDF